MSLNDMDRRLRRLENLVFRAIVGTINPTPGATTEAVLIDASGKPIGETAPVMGPPGVIPVPPPASQLLVVNVRHGQDPVAIAGIGTPAAVLASAVHVATARAAGGGLVLLDPVTGTGGLVITPAGVDVRGALTKNGSPFP